MGGVGGNSCIIFAKITRHKYDDGILLPVFPVPTTHRPRKPFPRSMEGSSKTRVHCTGVNKEISTIQTAATNAITGLEHILLTLRKCCVVNAFSLYT